ncbi:hypothetical protein WH8501_18740 [Crocosphaera watsonii WH 8501]|uniref:Uncharacterized protein n=7 Tax=Crocosphaera watsonii TaxID=263511 RepID=Q4C660_CROWT|nr:MULTISPECIES: hypothetical protein [Crocosphaera]EAM51563.1 hypothetical protein CwatDRAFT_4707 [Crocosphaera watsonii WH 8501]MCH2244880.1 hypothetical protein [Crocosphaera sp.]NQZ61646.1 hypothetical protein [Crocosphaera sp.]CCQ49422.1 FIG00565260: hypothetical protein [Crocosphaera watsonii WH 8502]CCQ58537.1 hypothetical protein CWATWH0005_1753 [Crocosphaera watsonii WH 0005]
MLKKVIAPILVLAFAITNLTILGLNLRNLAQSRIEEQDYFVKVDRQANIAIVEPNYGYFFHPDPEVKGDPTGEVLYEALNSIEQEYGVKETKMISFERKGYMIPNLYVFLKSNQPQETIANSQSVDQLSM